MTAITEKDKLDFSKDSDKNIFLFFTNIKDNVSINNLCTKCGVDYNECIKLNYDELVKKCKNFEDYLAQ